jgi:hypothetical protein
LQKVIASMERLVAAHPGYWNSVFAGGELLIGAAMLFSRAGLVARVACWSSIAFGAGVWIVGEGAGGLLTGQAALSTGAPGAALLYVVLTVAAWPALVGGQSSQAERMLPDSLLKVTWIFVWVCGAVLALLPNQRGANGLGDQAAMGWMMSPSWATHPTHALATWLAGLTPWTAAALSTALVLVFLAVASAPLTRGATARCGLAAGVGISLFFWMFGQGFGGLSTGTATDVGTGPLLVMLTVAVSSLGTARRSEPSVLQQRR